MNVAPNQPHSAAISGVVHVLSMANRFFVVAVIAGSLLAPAGCGGDDGAGDALRRVAEAACEMRARCLSLGRYEEDFMRLPSADCPEEAARFIEDLVAARLRRSVEAGRLRYSPERAQECLALMRDQLRCDVREVATGCLAAAFVGTVAPGGACHRSHECDEGICEDDACADACCEGTCLALPRAGEPCLRGECAGGAHCDRSDGLCRPPGEAGEPCEYPEECLPGLHCVAGTCAPPAGAGEPCGPGVAPACAPDAICITELGGEVGTCSTAESLFTAEEGDACGAEAGALCRIGLSCVVVDEVDWTLECVEPSASGAPCRTGVPDSCLPDAHCAGTGFGDHDGTCTPLPGDGETCLAAHEGFACASGYACVRASETDSGTCRPLRRLGETCTEEPWRPEEGDSNHCYSDVCLDDVCVTEDEQRCR